MPLIDPVNEVIAVVADYEGLVSAMVARRHELGLSQIAIDEIAGLADRYLSKIEAGTKRLGVMSLSSLLPALGLELVIRRTIPHHIRQGRLPQSSCGQMRDHAPSRRPVPAAA